MPIPYFQPVIGSSFDAIAAQQQGWQGFNRGVEENNAARLAAAQQAQNNWLAQVAALRGQAEQRNVNLQLAQDEADRRSVERAQDIALNKTMWQERLAAERERTQAIGRAQQMAFDIQQRKAEQEIEVHGQTSAANYLRAKLNADTAQKTLRDLEADIETKTAQAKTAKAKDAIDLGNELKDLRKRHAVAVVDVQRAERQFETTQLDIKKNGQFDINTDEQAIVHNGTGKRWSFAGAVKEATKPAAVSEPNALMRIYRRAIAERGGTPGWVPPPTETGTQPTPVAAAPSPILPPPTAAPMRIISHTIRPTQTLTAPPAAAPPPPAPAPALFAPPAEMAPREEDLPPQQEGVIQMQDIPSWPSKPDGLYKLYSTGRISKSQALEAFTRLFPRTVSQMWASKLAAAPEWMTGRYQTPKTEFLPAQLSPTRQAGYFSPYE